MNKNAIQKYAIWARNELIEQVKQRAYQYGISAKGYGDENAAVIAGRVLSSDEKRQRADFVSEIKRNGFEQAVEEVAYTWFNRFVALRFMEVNDYLSTHVRVFGRVGFNLSQGRASLRFGQIESFRNAERQPNGRTLPLSIAHPVQRTERRPAGDVRRAWRLHRNASSKQHFETRERCRATSEGHPRRRF